MYGKTLLLRLAGVGGVLAAFALVLGGTPVARAGGKKEASKVKLTATATPVDKAGMQVVTITMNIENDWHAYANPVKNMDLEAAETTVNITSGTKLQEVKINYPMGKLQIEGKQQYYVYQGKVEIQATIKRAAGDTAPLEVSVKYMTCNDVTKICLFPEQVKLQVK